MANDKNLVIILTVNPLSNLERLAESCEYCYLIFNPTLLTPAGPLQNHENIYFVHPTPRWNGPWMLRDDCWGALHVTLPHFGTICFTI